MGQWPRELVLRRTVRRRCRRLIYQALGRLGRFILAKTPRKSSLDHQPVRKQWFYRRFY
jgi:hypothetical protein